MEDSGADDKSPENDRVVQEIPNFKRGGSTKSSKRLDPDVIKDENQGAQPNRAWQQDVAEIDNIRKRVNAAYWENRELRHRLAPFKSASVAAESAPVTENVIDRDQVIKTLEVERSGRKLRWRVDYG